jgi:hypothetical protein
MLHCGGGEEVGVVGGIGSTDSIEMSFCVSHFSDALNVTDIRMLGTTALIRAYVELKGAAQRLVFRIDKNVSYQISAT